MISFFLAIKPFKTTHHAKKIVRRGRFVGLADKPELVKARETYDALLMPFRPEKPLEGALSLRLMFHFPYLKSHSRKFREYIQHKKTKPDCSNLAKTFEDCLCRMGFFNDDGQVAHLRVEKAYSSSPGVYVAIFSLSESSVGPLQEVLPVNKAEK